MTKHKKIAEKKAVAAPKKVAAKAKPTSKLGQLAGMLRRPEGATIPQLVKALGWQAHSVRGAMSGSLKKKQGLRSATNKVEGEERATRCERNFCSPTALPEPRVLVLPFG